MTALPPPASFRHGQLADSPAEIPARGWRQVARRVAMRLLQDRVLLIAAGVTYFTLMALVPALVVFISLYGLVSDPARVKNQMDLLTGLLPPGGIDILDDQLTRLTTTGTPALSLTLLVSLAVALWSAAAGVRAMFDAMNIAYGEAEKRNYFLLNLMALGFTLAAVVAAVVFLVVVVLIPVGLALFSPGPGLGWLVRLASYALLALLLVGGIGTLYRWGPSRAPAKWRWLSPGIAIAVIGTGIVSVLFSWYAANFSNYNATYGSLGALVGLLTWIWLSIAIIIVGAEFDAELEHQTMRDSTTGQPRPLGQRGAFMADHVAGHEVTETAKSEDRRRDRLGLLGLAVLLALASTAARPRGRR